jgi:hypothetical protein
MSMAFDANNDYIEVYVHNNLFNHPNELEFGWKTMMSSTVAIFDRFFKDIDPRRIHLDVCTSWMFGTQKQTTRKRLVDAVREAASGRFDTLIQHIRRTNERTPKPI